jgi:hypothetical protein
LECEDIISLEVAASTLDEHFTALRRAVDSELIRSRGQLLEELTRALHRLRTASNESEWNAAVAESTNAFKGDPAALEFLSTLAAITAPSKEGEPLAPDQDLSLRAQRFARVKVAEIQLYQPAKVTAGRAARDLYGSLQPHIDAARAVFRERFLTPGRKIADYLHAELVRTLANDDAELLGPGYPGPMA